MLSFLLLLVDPKRENEKKREKYDKILMVAISIHAVLNQGRFLITEPRPGSFFRASGCVFGRGEGGGGRSSEGSNMSPHGS